MFAYAVLGHLLFGTLLEDWSSLPDALYAVTRMAMFHYDLDAMQSATEPAFAAIYFASFMFIIANLLLWMFLAIVMVRRAEGAG